MQDWFNLVGWWQTEVVYPSEDGHPSQWEPGPTQGNFVVVAAVG